jgi:hypothetical protein
VSDKEKQPPFVMINKQVLDSRAWRAMSMGARVLYIALKRRYWSDRHNNGRIYLSQRQAEKEIGRDTNQITRWFRELQHYGFIVQTQRGSLGLDGAGRAPHWRLTECGYQKQTATQDYLRWDGMPFREVADPSPYKRTKSPTAFCAACSVEFKPKRSNAQYCSSTCRLRAYRNGKRIPVRESTDTYVRETTDTIVRESTDTATDNRPRNHGHTQRISVRESTDISSIPSSGSGKLRWTTPALTEIPVAACCLDAGTALPTDPPCAEQQL